VRTGYNHSVPNGFRPPLGISNLIGFRRSTLILAAILGLAAGAPAARPALADSPFDLTRSMPDEILLAQRALEDTTAATQEPPASATGTIGELPPAPESEPQPKKPGVGVLLSLVLPGAGHLYAGESRGWVNIGLDVATWASYFIYKDLGNSKEDEFEDFADGHWDYARWLSVGSSNGCAACYAGSPEDSLIRYFRDENEQHYYEDIGKIQTYWYGWSNWVPNTLPADDLDYGESPDRRFYVGMRNHSNNYLKNSRYSFTAAMVNRVVSAVDVFRILKKRTMPKLDEHTSLRMQLRVPPFSQETRVGFVVTRRL
jgi:hypothetical protein